MSKQILLSIRPEWVAKILNGEKTIEVRKQFTKDYVGWVYIYCTKDYKKILFENGGYGWRLNTWNKNKNAITTNNGKVVARFYCDKVETISLPYYTYFGTNKWVSCENERTLQTETIDEQELLKKSCISEEQIYKYLNFKKSPKQVGYAIHISKLEIFDEPKELSDFKYWKDKSEYGCWYENKLSKAPQNYCYIEGEE